MDIHIHPFVRRQTPTSQFSHWTRTDDVLIGLIQSNWASHKRGYRDGVILVPVPPEGFFTGVVTLQYGDSLKGAYVPRQPGETPRKQITMDTGHGDVASRKVPAVSVDIVLYRDDVLAETGDGTGHEWNVISVNASPTEGTMPMPPETLMANHFQDSGGTATHMAAEEFVNALQESYFFWRDKAFIE